jgi:acyl-CoA synthetase (AMP-forming)/AMP-acid ligase II
VSSGSGGGASSARTATFTLGPSTKVIADDGTEVRPGDDAIGKIAIKGRTPVGYYKDPTKSAETFVRIGDATYSMPGDYARVEADGTLVLLGRGSDAVVVGLPDERFGQAITAVVEAVPGTDPSPDELIATVKAHHAAYKAPKRIVFVDSLSRAANGKVDYKRWTRHAAGALGVDEG